MNNTTITDFVLPNTGKHEVVIVMTRDHLYKLLSAELIINKVPIACICKSDLGFDTFHILFGSKVRFRQNYLHTSENGALRNLAAFARKKIFEKR